MSVFDSVFQNASNVNKHQKQFSESVDSIAALLYKYSIEDVATSLFVSCLWLPNIASPIKHLFATSVFTSIRPENLSQIPTIRSYSDFLEFMKALYELLPEFPTLEDYIPETDWGEIRYYFDNSRYRIFYGTELSNVHDYISLFELLHVPFDKEYVGCIERSPKQELKYTLSFQDKIISQIGLQPPAENIDIRPGHIEVPPEAFWKGSSSIYKDFVSTNLIDIERTKLFSMPLGTLPKEHLDYENFGNMLFSEKLLPAYFVSHNERYFPILPRRMISILFATWGELFKNNKASVEKEKIYQREVLGSFYGFAKQRIDKKRFFAFVTARTSEGSAHDVLFPIAITSKDKLILFYVVTPSHDAAEIAKEIDKISPKLKEAKDLLQAYPTQLILHGEGKRVEFTSQDRDISMVPELFIVIPQTSPDLAPVKFSIDPPGMVAFMDDILAILDELEDVDNLADFIGWLSEVDSLIKFPGTSLLDKFAAFKDSHGVLVGGAVQPNFVGLYAHWGSEFRYRNLSKFWASFPEADFFGHPRSWKISLEPPSTRIRLISRMFFGCTLFRKIGKMHIYFNSPFEEIDDYENSNVANFLMECAEDVISKHQEIFSKHKIFSAYDRLLISFFPNSLLAKNNQFAHLRHLDPGENLWRSDSGFPGNGFPGIRIVFNTAAILAAFSEPKDRTQEIKLGMEILDGLNSISHDSNLGALKNSLMEEQSSRPRYTFFSSPKLASFPEHVQSLTPSPQDFKKVKKRIAELAQLNGFNPGEYKLDEAKSKLNKLRSAMVSDINSMIAQYSFKKSLPFLLTRIDALSDQYERNHLSLKHSTSLDVDYQRDARFAEEENQYHQMHRNYRYLIEKFVQIQPEGTNSVVADDLKYLLAFTDWLHVIYSASDSLHYGINPVGLKIDTDLLINVTYEGEIETRQDQFGKEQARVKLGLAGNADDELRANIPLNELIDELDKAYLNDFQFGFKDMINVLQILSHWPVNSEQIESPFYSASVGEIRNACKKGINGFDETKIENILEFLTLKSHEVVQILNQSKPCDDIPVWEYKKRFARYNIRPLIKVDGKYYWGPYSTRKAGVIWSGNPSYGTLPADIGGVNLDSFLEKVKQTLDKTLEKKCVEVVKRYTNHAETVDLSSRDRSGGHSQDLGDYDVLAYHPKINTIFNIECKNLPPVFCLKDSKSLRETIFGEPGKDEGHFRQIKKRQSYLEKNWSSIGKVLQWPLKSLEPPKIISLYVTPKNYWWTRYPPENVQTTFVEVKLLSSFIGSLLNESSASSNDNKT